MSKPVDKISIKGFKSIKNIVDFKLSRGINILVGANGVGKSNFIGVFKLLNQIINKNLQIYVGKNAGAEKFLYFGAKETSTISIEVTFDFNKYEIELSKAISDDLIIQDEWVEFGTTRKYLPREAVSVWETAIYEAEQYNDIKNIAKYVEESLKNWVVYHFHDTGATSPIKNTNKIYENTKLEKDAKNISAYLAYLRKNYRFEYNNIESMVKSVAPFFKEFNFSFSGNGSSEMDSVRLIWKHKDSDAAFDISDFSDGTLRFICLATLLLQPKHLLPSTILIDEPELGLHPAAINALAEMLQVASKSVQVILSTQSVTLLNQFTYKDIIVAERENNSTIFKRLDEKQIENWLNDYQGLGDVWEKNVFGGRP